MARCSDTTTGWHAQDRFKPWHTPTGEMNRHWNYDLALAFARPNPEACVVR
jgi:hypothetical protein